VAAVFALLPPGGGRGAKRRGVGIRLWGDADRVLVLPFEDRTGDPALASLGIMAADWITEGIARTGVANVVDPAGALAAHRDTGDPLALAGLFQAGSWWPAGTRWEGTRSGSRRASWTGRAGPSFAPSPGDGTPGGAPTLDWSPCARPPSRRWPSTWIP
jgi:hypothetical protein